MTTYENFITSKDEKRTSILWNAQKIEVTLLKFTERGIDRLKYWKNSDIKVMLCPFYGMCEICKKIFMDNDIVGCPCREFGTGVCVQVAKKIIKYSEGG